jgi:hypothetical protein
MFHLTQDAVVKEMELKHSCEREVFEIILNEETNSSMRKRTKTLSLEQMKDRLFELKVTCINQPIELNGPSF